MPKLSDLAKDSRIYREEIRDLGGKLETIVQDPRQLFFGSLPERIIITSLELLQQGDLSVHERLWNLSVLQILKSYLPTGNLSMLNQNPKKGPVCRGALELFSTKGLDCKPRVKSESNGKIEMSPVNKELMHKGVILAVMEALKRVEVIVNINNILGKGVYRPPLLCRMHDILFDPRSLDDVSVVNSMALELLEYVNQKHTPLDYQIQCSYHILRHLGTFYPIAPHIVEPWSTAGKPFEVIQQRLQYQAEFQPRIQNFILWNQSDKFMLELLGGLTQWHSINLGYIESCLESLNVRDSALEDSQARSGQNFYRKEINYAARDFFIEMMFKAAPYIEGLRKSLNRQVKKDEASGHYQFRSRPSLDPEDENQNSERCSICLGEFLQGQSVVKLRCDHIHHESCTNDLFCPQCRKGITLPLTKDQHISWK
ncbi:uncharacterized protein MELLADRAFT_107751 [Melampsora larici-populina 98AG31]|uniref:RING-type domain-containing protein n=1 Tax=Melampsora larici-populina (strain 98AG31 / pathotype 3-4-7) TaxID=747676 RepID=F4RQU2_MELLP|nr:uncharacterized protein MELLADRAFT_107751 [Melampsora larici-populina 98AG31]EGG05099.1 hypothetical protein MELLADRAFT_107751 [Melampsora larici-populina 98AG31]